MLQVLIVSRLDTRPSRLWKADKSTLCQLLLGLSVLQNYTFPLINSLITFLHHMRAYFLSPTVLHLLQRKFYWHQLTEGNNSRYHQKSSSDPQHLTLMLLSLDRRELHSLINSYYSFNKVLQPLPKLHGHILIAKVNSRLTTHTYHRFINQSCLS